MSRIRGSNTGPERALRSALHMRGLRFRKNLKSLPGTPDVVFVSAQVAVFVDGDFWHGWRFGDWEAQLQPRWAEKIRVNIARDRRVEMQLRRLGWRVIRVWEHDIEFRLERVTSIIEHTVRRRAARPLKATSST